ncbi:LPS assembly lipoprotein LptE [Sneathiella chinensis]|uniref:LPS-assembly lipoprotein LptE n=1 Tax=Sneathiella chinensis TaxID=349750 RepID=A0ABQ5TYD7_9PROT|nr:LPS assembly lipoprotein LptE [Sneathiella chinensis]GLQ04952.1 hypothetical protein GCM10007924_01730 [Sneathiella chinensis]
MLSFKQICAISLALLAGACGFQPLYGKQNDSSVVRDRLAATYVMPIEGRTGQIVRNELLDRVTPAGTPDGTKYRLMVKISERKQGLAIKEDDSTTRYNLTLSALYTLLDSTGKNTLYQGSAQSIASFNIVDSDFANLAAEKNARKRSALVLAEKIHRQLSVYMSR